MQDIIKPGERIVEFSLEEDDAHWNKKERGTLMLTRNVGQRIVIQDDIFIFIAGVRNKQVRLGIDAPTHITVHREEIYRKILMQKRGGLN